MVEYKVVTNSFETTISACETPMVPSRDHGNLPPSLWGGQEGRPVLVNQNGEFKTRGEIQAIYETQPYYNLVMGGYRTITAFAQLNAEAVEDLEVWENDHEHTTVYHVQFTPHAEKGRVYHPILDEDEVIEIREPDFMNRSMKILAPYQEIEAEGNDDATYLTYVAFGGATYRAVIHERGL